MKNAPRHSDYKKQHYLNGHKTLKRLRQYYTGSVRFLLVITTSLGRKDKIRNQNQRKGGASGEKEVKEIAGREQGKNKEEAANEKRGEEKEKKNEKRLKRGHEIKEITNLCCFLFRLPSMPCRNCRSQSSSRPWTST